MVNTDFDVMKEFLTFGSELVGEFQIPALEPVNIRPVDTIDFESSFGRKVLNCRELAVNFYIQDFKFQRLFNNPEKYIPYLQNFHCVIQPDFSISTQMSKALNIYNKWRNHALAHFMTLHGIKVIPSVSIMPYECRQWLLDGIPEHSTVSCCTNGRIRAKSAREEFCEGFYEMCEYLHPNRVVVVGKLPPELNSPVEIINLQSRNQKMNEKFGGR